MKEHYCTVPMEIVVGSDGKPHYVFCGKEATHAVDRSYWWVCEEHANTMKRDGRYKLIAKEEMTDEEQREASIGGCECIGSLAEGDRKACTCGQKGNC